jgi:hypothetical protein
MADKPQERISEATKEADRRDAKAEHGANEEPTPEEMEAAERAGGPSPETAEHYKEMTDKGANHPGEGRVS